MFTPALQELRSYFGRDYLLGVFFPLLIFLGISLALYFEVFQKGAVVAFVGWEKLSLQTQVLSVLAGLIVNTVLSYLIYNFQYVITRLFEGYWPRIGFLKWLRHRRTEYYKRRWIFLEEQKQSGSKLTDSEMEEIIEEQLAFYPPPTHLDRLMPTRIGNVLRASEIYALDRYGMDSIIIWTRLRPLLPDKALISLQDYNVAIDFMLLMTILSVAFTVIWCPLLAILTNHWVLFLFCAFGWPLAWLCYQNAVQRALDFSEELKAIFDLYRQELLKALNLPITTEAEKREWQALRNFFYFNLLITAKQSIWKRVALSFRELLKRN